MAFIALNYSLVSFFNVCDVCVIIYTSDACRDRRSDEKRG